MLGSGMTELKLTELEDETFGVIPLAIATSQLTNGSGLTDLLRSRLQLALKEAREAVNFWEWNDEDILSQANWVSLRVTPEETQRFCEEVFGSKEAFSKERLVDALVSVSTVLGVVYETDEEIYTTVIDGAGYGFTVKVNSYVDPSYERIINRFRGIPTSPGYDGISRHLKPGVSGFDLVSQYTAWTVTYCNLRDLRVRDFLDSFARFEEI